MIFFSCMKRMKCFLLRCVLLLASLQRSDLQTTVPATVLNCCEGDILLLLDSSGSVANHEFLNLVHFAAELVRPFTLGRGHIRVGLLQVSTNPNLEFGLDVHSNQHSLQEALVRVSQMQGDTNTMAALRLAQQVLTGTQENVPKVLLWLTDGVEPGDVDKPMSELKARGVSVLVVSTVHANYQVLQRAVTPPLESHLYSVDIDDIHIITEDMREAILKIFCAERLCVVHVTSHSAVLQWPPVLRNSVYYELWYNSVLKMDPEIRITLPFDSTSVELTSLQPDTTYTVSLRPETNQMLFNTRTVSFTTLPDALSPAVVSVSDSGPSHIRVRWGPLQPARVQKYTVEYGAIPSGHVRTVALHSQKNSILLTGLEPGTQYLVTVSALHMNGEIRAMSVRACTQEAAPPALVDLKLTPVEQQEVQVAWLANQEGLKGYWLRYERKKSHKSSSKPSVSSIYLPPTCHSVWLTHLIQSSRVCVSPIYSSGRGEGLCCTAQHDTDVSRKTMATVNDSVKQDDNKKLGRTGFHILDSPEQASIYVLLLALAIVGNTTVVGVIGKSVIREHGRARNSDIIIINMALSNLLVSLMKNTPLAVSDWGHQLQASKMSCQFLMGVSVWLRSVNVWSTFFLSAFHLLTLRRVSPTFGNQSCGVPKTLLLFLGLIWLLNFICSIPAHIFSTNGGGNATEKLMLVSSTTRPVLHCVWNFPSLYSGLAFATTSIVMHEITPILLMCFTSLCSLYTLYNHRRLWPLEQNATAIKRVPAEIRAAKVILALIMLFVTSWGTSVISVSYFNYNRSSSTEFLLVITRFSNIIFIALSPAALAFGHRRLRSFINRQYILLKHWTYCSRC